MKIAFLPIDNRPVCYTLPEIIAGIDDDIKFFIPPRELLGDLTKSADVESLLNWLENCPAQDAIILSLDTLVYGGLIPSRRCDGDLEDFLPRLERIKNILINKKAKIYATSSIMRISNNNINQEEKEYWAQYGEKIFKYSYEMSKNGSAQTDVPQDVLKDYLDTRRRNFEINKTFLKWQKDGIFDTLVFSKDDCAQYGFNVDEAKELEISGGFTKTGADEIPLSLLSRAITRHYSLPAGEGVVVNELCEDYNDGKGLEPGKNQNFSRVLKICPIFLEPECKNLISNYEDVSIENSVLGQIELAGCGIADENSADILLYLNNFKKHQGEIVMKKQTEMFDGGFKTPQKPYIIADVRFANGADNNFIDALFKNELKDENFYGYSGWNTSANTLGSLICGAVVKFSAKKYNAENFKKLQMTRFLDDWAYQANVRQTLPAPDICEVSEAMKPYEKIVADKFDFCPKINYTYPWNRLFEIEISFKD